MSRSRFDVIDKPPLEAHGTTWAIDCEGNFVLVLENEKGEAIAMASYSLCEWCATFANLMETAMRIAKEHESCEDHEHPSAH